MGKCKIVYNNYNCCVYIITPFAMVFISVGLIMPWKISCNYHSFYSVTYFIVYGSSNLSSFSQSVLILDAFRSQEIEK